MLSSDTDILLPASLVAGCTPCTHELLLSNGLQLLATNEFDCMVGAASKLVSRLFVWEEDTNASLGGDT